MRARNYFVGAAFALLAGGMAHSAVAEDIKIGEINSYSLLPSFTEPYRKGWQLAVEEVNAAGGINGKKLVVISCKGFWPFADTMKRGYPKLWHKLWHLLKTKKEDRKSVV